MERRENQSKFLKNSLTVIVHQRHERERERKEWKKKKVVSFHSATNKPRKQLLVNDTWREGGRAKKQSREEWKAYSRVCSTGSMPDYFVSRWNAAPPYARSASFLLASRALQSANHADPRRVQTCKYLHPASFVRFHWRTAGVGKCVMCFAPPFGKYQSLGFWIGACSGDPRSCWTGFQNVCSAYLANDTLCKWTWFRVMELIFIFHFIVFYFATTNQ